MTTRSSDPIDPGSNVPVGDDWTVVLDADDADRAVKFILQNNSDADMTIRLAAADGPGIALKSGGGLWEETLYAGPVYARHDVAGETRDLTRLIF